MHKIDLRKIDLNLLLLFEVLMQERSVSRAANVLGRSQSAVSHALGRLREQLGDPLLIKTNGRMQPSPFASELAIKVRPILRSIERILSPQQDFDAATSSKRFHLAIPDLTMNLFPYLGNRLQQGAPLIQIEWQTPRSSTLLDVAEGLVDLALLPEALARPEGVSSKSVGLLHWACFMREGHPAKERWNLAQWSAWPHISVGTGDRVQNPVELAAKTANIERRTGMVVPHFGAVAPLLAQTNMIATLPSVVLADAMQPFKLTVRKTPLKIAPMPHVIVWSARLNNDPANLWIRNCFSEIFQQKLEEANRLG